MLAIVWLHATAAPAQYRVDVWTTEQGLPQNIVRAVHSGRDGYLWLTTLDGLVRFDGFRFTLFDRANTEGIGSNRFTPLLEAPKQIVIDGPVVTAANAPGLLWMEDHFLI